MSAPLVGRLLRYGDGDMPHEKVYTESTPDNANPAYAQVEWVRDLHVQLAVLNPASEWQWAMLGSEAGRSATAAGFETFDGFWISLDRRRINDLIRALRRARDAAYGRDE